MVGVKKQKSLPYLYVHSIGIHSNSLLKSALTGCLALQLSIDYLLCSECTTFYVFYMSPSQSPGRNTLHQPHAFFSFSATVYSKACTNTKRAHCKNIIQSVGI
ncbi:hypothetical protein GOODEAATRI_032577 [Goodea atripinnis]|uniref:Uncharacterized protein n=1 Tax=Goodea atripinnis TaxID=208336 RepID=A0ABV0NFL6_9TELE